MTAIGLGWRVRHSSAVVVAISGPAASPALVHREVVALIQDESMREPYHAAVGLPVDEVAALVESVEETATAAAAAIIEGFVSAIGAVAAVGVVGGSRRLPDLPQILTKHALLHAAERNLYEQAIVGGATRAQLPVTTIPATGKLFDHAAQLLGVDVALSLAALGKSIGPPWQNDHKEAAAAALVALDAMTSTDST